MAGDGSDSVADKADFLRQAAGGRFELEVPGEVLRAGLVQAGQVVLTFMENLLELEFFHRLGTGNSLGDGIVLVQVLGADIGTQVGPFTFRGGERAVNEVELSEPPDESGAMPVTVRGMDLELAAQRVIVVGGIVRGVRPVHRRPAVAEVYCVLSWMRSSLVVLPVDRNALGEVS
jgi:hypothetical protein